MRTYEIDGERFATLDEFAAEFSRVVLEDYAWNGNLDAFNDILRGGFGTPDEGFVLRWRNHDVSRERLGYPETVRWLEVNLTRCHSSNRQRVENDLERARRGDGTTVFDWLVEIIRDHGEGGSQSQDNVRLVLA